MTVVELRVEAAGVACVQDLGRPGLAHLGIAANGAADARAARVANVLAGNEVGAPLFEVTASAFGLAADADVLVAVTGAADRLLVAGVPQPTWETAVVPAGRPVLVPEPAAGLRCYVAVHGRIEADVVLGSVAPDRLLGVGRALHGGDVVRVETPFAGLDHPASRVPLFRFGARPPRVRRPLVVEVTPGPDAHEFPDEALEGAYAVSEQSDQVGLRLLGPAPGRSTAREILSRGVPVGAVEAPPAGGLLVLLRGRLVTAGYPVLAVATVASVDRLGQARPGDAIRFRTVDLAEARACLRRGQDELERLAARVAAAFGEVGLSAGGAGLQPIDAAEADPLP